jgi:hypothetical protein
MPTDHVLALAIAIYTLGGSSGDYFLQTKFIRLQKFGRALKIGSGLGAGYTAVNGIWRPYQYDVHGGYAVFNVTGLILIGFIMMMYFADSRGLLKDPD